MLAELQNSAVQKVEKGSTIGYSGALIATLAADENRTQELGEGPKRWVWRLVAGREGGDD